MMSNNKRKNSQRKAKRPRKQEVHVDGYWKTLEDGSRTYVRPHYRKKPS